MRSGISVMEAGLTKQDLFENLFKLTWDVEGGWHASGYSRGRQCRHWTSHRFPFLASMYTQFRPC